MTSTIGVKIDDELRDRLSSLGKAKDRSPHWLMKKAIAEYLDREERYEAEKREDAKRWDDYVSTGQHLSNDEMLAWMNSLADRSQD